MLAGVVELSLGTYIRPWIGNKENPFVLGWVTLLLSGLAWITIRLLQKHIPSTADGKLATILGVLVPAGVCFTTVGMLWYLPGICSRYQPPSSLLTSGTIVRVRKSIRGVG